MAAFLSGSTRTTHPLSSEDALRQVTLRFAGKERVIERSLVLEATSLVTDLPDVSLNNLTQDEYDNLLIGNNMWWDQKFQKEVHRVYPTPVAATLKGAIQ